MGGRRRDSPSGPGNARNKSHRGVSVRMKDAVRVGSHITVKWGSEQLSGIVTNCRREKAAYVVGVRRDAGESRDRK